MFTGIIEEVGRLERIQRGAKSARLAIAARRITEDLRLGDSVAVNGVCLTVTDFQKQGFWADVMHETLNRSSLGALQAGSLVNLERAMAANGRFGGHIVAGHVDGLGKIIGISKDDNAIWFTLQAEEKIMRYVVEKGSVAIDGISLTVAWVREGQFAVSVIPHTAKETTLGERKTGDMVNLETDIVGKYIEKLVGFPQDLSAKATSEEGGLLPAERESGITNELLSRCGFL